MGATLLGLTVPDLSLWNIRGTKVTTTVINGGVEGPRCLERWGRAGALSGDKPRDEGDGDDEGSERTHFHRDTGRTVLRESSV